jgi:hypothetical protein
MKSISGAALIFFAAIFIHSSEVATISAKADGFADVSQDTNAIQSKSFEFNTNRIPILNNTYKGKNYTYFTTYSNLWKTPRWQVSEVGSSFSEPPLSVGSAVLAAKKYAQGLFPTNTICRTTKVEIEYAMDNIWFYDVKFEAFVPLGHSQSAFANFLHPDGFSTGPGVTIDIVVLMDGSVPDREEQK